MSEPAQGLDFVIRNIKHEDVDVDRLRQHPRNPNQGDFGAIYTLVKENGFYGELIVQVEEWKEIDGEQVPWAGVILAGNHRFAAAVELGANKLPVAWIDVPPTRQLKILMGDNRASDLRDYDQRGVVDILDEVYEEDGDLTGTGYDEDDLDQMHADMEFDEEIGALTGTEERQWSPEERYENQYMSTDLRQIIVVMHQKEYAWALGILRDMHTLETDISTNASAVLLLLRRWREEHPDAETANAPEELGDEGTDDLGEDEEVDSAG